MFLPVGDTPNHPGFKSWVNWGLIAVNVAVFLFISWPLSSRGVDLRDPALREYLNTLGHALTSEQALWQFVHQLSAYDLFVFEHGYKPGAPGLLDLFFSMFLHANLWHLAGNMLFLWIYGDNVEHRLGRVGYLIAYLVTGVTAVLFFSLFAGSSMVPMVGASGAISGVLGLYFVLFPRNEVKVFIFFILIAVVLLPARLVLGIYLVLDNLLPFLMGASSGVAHGAHIGGFLGGLAIAWIGERINWRMPRRDEARPWGKGLGRKKGAAREAGADRVAEVRDALRRGDPDGALRLVARMDRGELARLEPGEWVLMACRLEQQGHSEAAAKLLRYCLSCHGKSKGLAEVYLMLGLMRLDQGQPAAAYQHLLSVFDYDPAPEVAARARAALDRINIYRRRY